MSHSPPVPPGNKSPFPIQEAPHVPTSPVATNDEWAVDEPKSSWSLGKIIGAAAGVGAIAFGVVAVLFPRQAPAKPKKTKKSKR